MYSFSLHSNSGKTKEFILASVNFAHKRKLYQSNANARESDIVMIAVKKKIRDGIYQIAVQWQMLNFKKEFQVSNVVQELRMEKLA